MAPRKLEDSLDVEIVMAAGQWNAILLAGASILITIAVVLICACCQKKKPMKNYKRTQTVGATEPKAQEDSVITPGSDTLSSLVDVPCQPAGEPYVAPYSPQIPEGAGAPAPAPARPLALAPAGAPAVSSIEVPKAQYFKLMSARGGVSPVKLARMPAFQQKTIGTPSYHLTTYTAGMTKSGSCGYDVHSTSPKSSGAVGRMPRSMSVTATNGDASTKTGKSTSSASITREEQPARSFLVKQP